MEKFQIDKNIILVTQARTGSSWVNHYVTKFNIRYRGCKKFNVGEFLQPEKLNVLPNVIFKGSDEKVFKKKIKWLENQRTNGNEYTYKVKLTNIENNINWFKNFYKDWHIVKLERKDVVKQFISTAIQDKIGWKHPKFISDKFTIDLEYVDYYIEKINRLENINVHNDIWYYEDLTDNYLENFLQVKGTYIENIDDALIRRNNYENNIINYNKLIDKFNERWYNKI